METLEKETVEQERYDRERSFHNWVFSEKGRASVNKFYSISDLSQNYYRERILNQGAHDILEIGCGRGSVASFLSRDVAFTAIDISDVAVQETADVARANGIAGSYLLMNAEETAFADNSFDLICGTGILHHLNLEKACAGNPALRREVEALLSAHAADNPLDRPPADLARTGDHDATDAGPPLGRTARRVSTDT